MSVYSPPFCGLYKYSSAAADMSNCRTWEEFFTHYGFLVEEIRRVTMPGRMSAVHCMDVPGKDGDLLDFPGEIIRLHKRAGISLSCEVCHMERALRVAIRTRSRGLMHKQIVKDSSLSNNAGADYLLVFRNAGENPVPIAHPRGLTTYVGEREIPETFTDYENVTRHRSEYDNWKDPQTNKVAHWIWQQYASSFWDDIRNSRVLPYREARESEDEKHIHPLQLDVIERAVLL